MEPPADVATEHLTFQENDNGRQRFLLELEFVQLLANPAYINHLAQNRFFDDPAFVKYLQYLQYWKRPEYARFIVYPHCFHFLDLLQEEAFRKAVASVQNKELLHTQQFYFWKYYRTNRLQKFLENKTEDQPVDQNGGGPLDEKLIDERQAAGGLDVQAGTQSGERKRKEPG